MTPSRAIRGAPRVLGAVLMVLMVLAAPAAFAQKAVLQAVPGPYYAGTPIDLQIVADGFDEEPQPQMDAPGVQQGATLEFVATRPQVSSFMSIVNGQITQRKEVRFAFVYRFTATAPGRYALGPFQVTQDARSAATKAVAFDVVEVPLAQGQSLRMMVGSAAQPRLFVGQRVPVTVEWWTEAGLADSLYNQRLSVPLFMQGNAFQFVEDSREQSRLTLNIETPAGTVEFPATLRQQSEGGKQWMIRAVTRTMIPIAPGTYDLDPATLWVDQATGWRRDFFGSRIPTQVQKRRISADKQTFVVEPLPAAGRPSSFGGAIGEGFTLETSADRTVVQTGDPIKLTLTLRGDGSFESAALPPLAGAGLSPKQLRLPDGEIAGVFDNGVKRFDVTVRILDPNLREIPPIAYSWFNPKTQSYETARSQPIALSVRAAEVVGAGDVVSAAPETPPTEPDKQARGEKARDAGGAPNVFTLTGADLSIETDPASLSNGNSSMLAAPALRVWAYALGVLALLAGVLVRRRSDTDPEIARLRKALDRERARIAGASDAGAVAAALRRMAALQPPPALQRRQTAQQSPAATIDIDSLLGRLDELVFAPGGAASAATEDLRKRALAVADALREQAR
ncbi:MAG: BatD family protein [Deltaproteobacteria bacterium]|nr:BatD family protein [Deltaproteobacteria bacterium]